MSYAKGMLGLALTFAIAASLTFSVAAFATHIDAEEKPFSAFLEWLGGLFGGETQISVTGQALVNPSTTGLKGLWYFDEGSGTAAADSSGNGNGGTLVNGASFTSAGCADGTCIGFDGTDDFIQGNSPGTGFPTGSSARTIEAWIKTAATGADRNIFHYGTDGGFSPGLNFHLFVSSGGNISVGNGYGYGIITGSFVADNSLHHVVGIYEGSGTNTARLYVDGVEVASGTLSSVPATGAGNNWRIGLFMAGGIPFSGTIDEVAIYDRALSAAEIQANFLATCVAPPSNMVSWWDGDAVSGTTASDIQDGNSGTLTNGATTASGKVGQAFSFDGVDDRVRVNDSAGLRFAANFTIDAWVKTSASGTLSGGDLFADIVRKRNRDTGGSMDITCRMKNGKLEFAGNNDAGTAFASLGTSMINDGVFHHVVCVRRGSSAEVYVDGVLQNSTSISGTFQEVNAEPWAIGHSNPSSTVGGFPWNGLIDEVEIFNRALSASEIQSIFNAGSAGKCKQAFLQPAPGLNITAPAGSTFFVNGTTGEITVFDAGGQPFVTFPSGTTGNVVITVPTTAAGGGSTVINGATLPGAATKTVYVDKLLSTGRVCILDQEGATSVSESCTDAGEVAIGCPGSAGAFACADTGSQYKITGLSHTALAEQACVAPPSNLVSWWPGDGNATDIQGGHNGTLVNGATFATGKVGQAFSLDGTNDYVQIPDRPSLTPPTSSLTLDAWIRTDTVSTDANGRTIISKYNTNNPTVNGVSWFLGMLNGGGIQFTVYQNAGGSVRRSITTNAPVLTAGVFQHVAATFDISTQAMKIYVDGVEVPTSLQSGSTANITSIHDSSTPVRIGTFVNINGNFVGFWDGLIDEVEFFNRSLTASEVQAIYNAGSAGKCKAPVAPPPAAAVCGNSVVEAGEQCDPAATASAQCPSTAKTCTATCQCVAQCGNGFVEGTEQCDDGNNNNGDGCSAVCNIEPPICGNGILEAGEQCDPPALASAQCPAAAKTCSPFGCACVAQCGNGFVEGTEQCDDANTNNGDGCDNTCRAEVCGNGIVQFGEGCDDGNTVAGDGCSATCQLEGVAVPECTLFQMLDLNNDTTVNILDAIIEQREIVTLPNAANGGKGCEAVVVDAA